MNNQTEARGLFVSLFGSDCTLPTDPTNGKDSAVILHVDCDVFSPSIDAPALVLIKDQTGRVGPGKLNVHRNGQVYRVRAVPVDAEGKPRTDGMFSGQFVYSSDARFPFENPVPVHGRFEW